MEKLELGNPVGSYRKYQKFLQLNFSCYASGAYTDIFSFFGQHFTSTDETEISGHRNEVFKGNKQFLGIKSKVSRCKIGFYSCENEISRFSVVKIQFLGIKIRVSKDEREFWATNQSL